MISQHNIASYTHWIWNAHSKKGHGIHSPFLFNLITNSLHKPLEGNGFGEIELLRKQLECNKTELTISDLGSGSKFAKNGRRTIASVAKHSTSSVSDGRLLVRLMQTTDACNVVEVGTCIGLGTSYLAMAARQGRVTTIEGSVELANVATETFKKLNISNVAQMVGDASVKLKELVANADKLDFVFFDANHRSQPTIEYFKLCLPCVSNNSVFVFDDIHKNADMEQAWLEIIGNERVTLSLDFYTMGAVFFRRELSKQNILLRY